MKGKVIGAIIAVVLIAGGGVYYFGFYNTGGTLNVNVTDPLPAGWSSVYVNISSVSIHNSTGGGSGAYTKTFSTPVTMNLAKAASTSLFLTSLSLPPGHYQMIRVVITGAYGVYNNSGKPQTYTFTLVNGTVDIAGQFTISKGATTSVTLDFISAQAVHGSAAAGFTMSPVVAMTVG